MHGIIFGSRPNSAAQRFVNGKLSISLLPAAFLKDNVLILNWYCHEKIGFIKRVELRWLNYHRQIVVSLSRRRSTTVSLETRKPVAVMIWANSIKYHPV